jgi:serine/threonine protein kinase
MDGGFLCFVGELIEGKPLAAGKHLPLAVTLEVIASLAEAILYAHGHQVIHGALSPHGVIMTEDHSVKIVDYGIESAFRVPLLAGGENGGASGTVRRLEYAAPEILAGQTPDARSDLYGLGTIFYQLLAGTAPFEGEGSALMDRIGNQPAPDIRQVNLDAPAEVAALIEKLLRKSPNDRFQSAAEFLSQQATGGRGIPFGEDEAIDLFFAERFGRQGRAHGAVDSSRNRNNSATARQGDVDRFPESPGNLTDGLFHIELQPTV